MTCRQGIWVYITIIKKTNSRIYLESIFSFAFQVVAWSIPSWLDTVSAATATLTCNTLHYGLHPSTTSLASHSTAPPTPSPPHLTPPPTHCLPQSSATPPPGHTHHPAAPKQMHPLCFPRCIWAYEATNVPCSTRVSIVKSNIQV